MNSNCMFRRILHNFPIFTNLVHVISGDFSHNSAVTPVQPLQPLNLLYSNTHLSTCSSTCPPTQTRIDLTYWSKFYLIKTDLLSAFCSPRDCRQAMRLHTLSLPSPPLSPSHSLTEVYITICFLRCNKNKIFTVY